MKPRRFVTWICAAFALGVSVCPSPLASPGDPPRLPHSAPDTAVAIAHFDSCLATKMYRFVEYDYAKAERARLSARP